MAAMFIPALSRAYCFAPYIDDGRAYRRRTGAVFGAKPRVPGARAAEFAAVTLQGQKQQELQPACLLGVGVPLIAFCRE